MTIPMTENQKKKCKEDVLKGLFAVHKHINIARDLLLLSANDEFNSDKIVMAKNMVLDIHTISQEIEHELHEIMDAPLVEGSIEE